MIPALIESYLAATGKSRRKLARDIGVSNHTIGQWIAGKGIGNDLDLVALLDHVEAPTFTRSRVWAARFGVDHAELGRVVGLAAATVEAT